MQFKKIWNIMWSFKKFYILMWDVIFQSLLVFIISLNVELEIWYLEDLEFVYEMVQNIYSVKKENIDE